MKTMKKIFLLCLLLSIGYTNTYAQVEGEPVAAEFSNNPPTTYASLLSRFIVNMSKDAYSENLATTISKWDPTKTTRSQAFGILKEIDLNIKMSYFKPEWKTSQLRWRERLAKATERTDIVILLRELEENMLPNALEKTWGNDRGAWLNDIQIYLN